MKTTPILLAAAVALLLTACTEEKKDAAAPPAAPSSAPIKGVASNTAVQNKNIKCASVIPADVADAVKGWKLEEKQICENCPRDCSYSDEAKPGDSASFTWDCRRAVGPAEIEPMKEIFAKQKMVEYPGLGKAAFKGEPFPSMTQIAFWDDDTPCAINVTVNGKLKGQAESFAKSIATHTTTDRLK